MRMRRIGHNRPQNLSFGRLGALALSIFVIIGVLGSAAGPAQAYTWTKGQLARHQRYLACKVRLQKDPPCNQSWTRYCARQCNALFW